MSFRGLLEIKIYVKASLWLCLTSCSVFDGLPFQETKIKIIVQTETENKEQEPTIPDPPQLLAARLARRLTLDIAKRLPDTSEMTSLATSPSSRSRFVASLLSESSTPEAIAALHGRMWHLNHEDLPDLDEFAVTDSVFKNELAAIRADLSKEPLLLVRKVLEDKKPFKTVLTADFSITTPSMRDFFGYTDDGQAWSGEPYRYIRYADQRPEGGLLVTSGFLSFFQSRRETLPNLRTAQILGELTCRTPEAAKAHLFSDLSETEMASDLNPVALSHKACAGCHLQFTPVTPGLRGLATGSAFSSWKTYAPPSNASSGTYNSNGFSTLPELARLIGNDPQFMRCESEKLVGAILQKQVGNLEDPITSMILDSEKADEDLLTSLSVLFMSKQYGYAPLAPKTKGIYVRNASGTRFLRRHQFEALIQKWAPNLASEGLEMSLEPGIEEIAGADDMIPSGSYWHALDRYARRLASEIVKHDLADGTFPEGRYLLTSLPQGSGFGASDTAVTRQIIELWTRLTSETISNGSDTFIQLRDLWSSVQPGTSAAEFRRAWTLLLIGIFTHPSFVTY